MRRVGAYPPQLEDSDIFQMGYSNPNMNFVSCTGAVSIDVQNEQIPPLAISLPFVRVVTLSIGSKDIIKINI